MDSIGASKSLILHNYKKAEGIIIFALHRPKIFIFSPTDKSLQTYEWAPQNLNEQTNQGTCFWRTETGELCHSRTIRRCFSHYNEDPRLNLTGDCTKLFPDYNSSPFITGSSVLSQEKPITIPISCTNSWLNIYEYRHFCHIHHCLIMQMNLCLIPKTGKFGWNSPLDTF